MASTSGAYFIGDVIIDLEVLHIFVVEILQVEEVVFCIGVVRVLRGLALLLADGLEIFLDPLLDFLTNE